MGRLTRLVIAMLGLVVPASWALSAGPATADDVHPEWGHVQGQNAVLQRGCHAYTYTYAITPPPGNWVVEIFITGPTGLSVATPVLLINSDPLSGTHTFDLCKPATQPGVYTVVPKLSVIDGNQPEQDGFLPTTTFTLTQAPRPTRHPGVWHLVPIRR